jgi:hypothetical protein
MIAALALAALLAAPPTPPPLPAPPPAPGLPAARSAAPLPGEVKLVGEWPARASGRKVSLSGKQAVDRALQAIADAAGWSLVANTGRAGDRVLVLDMRDVPVEDALQAVLHGTPLAATRRGSTVTVAPFVAVPGESPTLTGFDVASGKRVTADFADAPVGKALRQIADAAGWSLVLPPGLGGVVNAQFKSTPVEDALRAVLSQSGLSASRDGALVTVSREFGPRVVVRGGKRQLVYGLAGEDLAVPSAEEVRRMKEDARAALEEARAAAEEARADAQDALADVQDEVAGPGVTSKGLTKSGNVTVGPGERRRDVVALRGNVRMQAGSAARQVTAILGSVELEPGVSVDREVVAIGGDVHVSPGAHVGRDAVSIGGQVIIDPGGTVDGEEVSVSVPGLLGVVGLLGGGSPEAREVERVSPALKVGHALAKYVVFFVLGLLVLLLAPARLDSVSATLSRQPAKVVLAGLLGTLAMPVLTVLLVVTLVGIPLVAVQVLAVLLAGLVGFTALAMLVGRALPLHPRRAAAVIQLALGTALVVLVSEIPVVGAMAWVTGWLFVFGAVIRSRFGQPQPGAPLPTSVPPAAPTAAA